MKYFTMLFVLGLLVNACGGNPQLKSKSLKIQTPLVAEKGDPRPELIIREKGSNQEKSFSGDSKAGGNQGIELELVNIGDATAKDITIPLTVGKFSIININCFSELEAKASCELRAEITQAVEVSEKNTLTVEYSTPEEKKLSASINLVATRVDTPKSDIAKPKLVLIRKSHPEGVLKDIPVGEKVTVELELKNVGDAKATEIQLPILHPPYRMLETNCGKVLLVNRSCNVFLEYTSPVKMKGELIFTVVYN